MRFKFITTCFLCQALLLGTFVSSAQVRLPQLFGNGMVLQRDTKINLWGWAAKGEKISIGLTTKPIKSRQY